MEKTEGNLHWQIVQNLMEGFDEDRTLTEIADDICSLLSQRIKAKALTDEQMLNAYYDNYSMENFNKAIKGVAAAQLQAILNELDIKENK